MFMACHTGPSRDLHTVFPVGGVNIQAFYGVFGGVFVFLLLSPCVVHGCRCPSKRKEMGLIRPGFAIFFFPCTLTYNMTCQITWFIDVTCDTIKMTCQRM